MTSTFKPLGASKATIAASSKNKGGMFNKYLTHPKMKRRIKKPRILLLDCRLGHKESENRRVARAGGAAIGNKADEITEEDIGTGAGLVEVRMIGDKCFTVLVQCKDPKDCTPLMRGVSKDILHEVKMNRQDALDGERNLYQRPSLVPGGGAMEKEVAHRLREKVKTMIKIARTQDEEVGDGTTSVIVLTAKMLEGTHQFLEGKRHPAGVIIKDTAATKINLEDASDGRGVI